MYRQRGFFANPADGVEVEALSGRERGGETAERESRSACPERSRGEILSKAKELWRKRVGVEPTRAGVDPTHTGFEVEALARRERGGEAAERESRAEILSEAKELRIGGSVCESNAPTPV